jgi:hypothetical protein
LEGRRLSIWEKYHEREEICYDLIWYNVMGIRITYEKAAKGVGGRGCWRGAGERLRGAIARRPFQGAVASDDSEGLDIDLHRLYRAQGSSDEALEGVI